VAGEARWARWAVQAVRNDAGTALGINLKRERPSMKAHPNIHPSEVLLEELLTPLGLSQSAWRCAIARLAAPRRTDRDAISAGGAIGFKLQAVCIDPSRGRDIENIRRLLRANRGGLETGEVQRSGTLRS